MRSIAVTNWSSWLVPVLAMSIFAVLGFYQYRLPGLYYDEAFDVVPAMQLLKGQEVQLSRGVGIHVLGRDFPVMIGDYWGVVSTYAVLPLFAIFGIGVFPIRLWSIGTGVIAVLLTYILGRRIYGQHVGALGSLLLGVFPSFIFWSRTGIYVISHIVTISLGIMLFFLQWRCTGQMRWLLLSGLLTGIGLSTKLLFLWFLIAIPSAYLFLLLADAVVEMRRDIPVRTMLKQSWFRFREDVPIRSTSELMLTILTFVIGAFPVIYYNIISQGSYLVLRANLFQTERGVDNFAVWKNLKIEADALGVLLDGGYFWYYGGIYTNPLYPWVAGLSAIGLLSLVHLAPEYRGYRRPTVFLLGFVMVTFVLSCFSVSILGATHLLILLPLPQLVIAAFAMFGGRWLSYRQSLAGLARAAVSGGFAALLLIPLAGRDLWVDGQYHNTLARGGGQSSFSSAIYTLAERMGDEGIDEPYALDWGFKYPIMILTEGRVTPLEIYGSTYEPGPDFEAALRQALTDPAPVFIAHDEEASSVPRLDAFRRIVGESGRAIVQQETIRQLDGKQVFYVFYVR